MAKLSTLQVARAAAVNLVVLSHLYVVELKSTAAGLLPSFTHYGMAGVDLFFVLSGFIMVAAAGRNIGPLKFLWRRAARIYPAYWLISAGVLAVMIASPQTVSEIYAMFPRATVSETPSIWRSFLLVPDTSMPILGVGWTLIYEAYFYLVFALFLALRIPVVAGLAAWAVLIVTAAVAFPDHVAASPVLQVWTSPLTAEFMAGALIGVIWLRGPMGGARLAGIAGLAGLAIAIVWIAPAMSLDTRADLNTWRVPIFGIPCALILYALAAAERRGEPHPPRLLVRLGDWSYGTYLVHAAIISALGRALAAWAPVAPIAASLVLIGVGFVAANLAGAALHVLVERPTLRWLHRLPAIVQGQALLRQRRQPEAAAGGGAKAGSRQGQALR